MPVWHTTKRLGNFGIKPSKDRIDKHGDRVTEKGVRLYLAPAWMGDEGHGPEILDTDNMSAANRESLERLFGDDWEKGLTEWMKKEGPRFGWSEGKGPERKIRVQVTESDLALLNEAKKAKGIEPTTIPDGTAQTLVQGTRTRGR